jgi:predicted transcriptional regulator
MACINPDGSVTPTAKSIIRALGQPLDLKALGQAVKVPQFVLKSGLRELVEHGYVKQEGEIYSTTDKGRKKL